MTDERLRYLRYEVWMRLVVLFVFWLVMLAMVGVVVVTVYERVQSRLPH